MGKRIYNFAVYITADDADGDGNGFTPDDIERLLSNTLNHYSGPLNKERRSLNVDYELMSSEEVK